jgi:hypothetical protein
LSAFHLVSFLSRERPKPEDGFSTYWEIDRFEKGCSPLRRRTVDGDWPVSNLWVRSQEVIHDGLSDPENFRAKDPKRNEAGPGEGYRTGKRRSSTARTKA